IYAFPDGKALVMPPFPQELLGEEVLQEDVQKVLKDMPESSAKSHKKHMKRKGSKKKKDEDKTDLINSEQSPPLNAVES
ncbi:hypothetical protein A2U01_0095911, partial [Trifolium medium]|nr:hypothetical protein [Trifolium medium]